MMQYSKHLLKINGVFVTNLKISKDGTPWFLDFEYGWLQLDDSLQIEVARIDAVNYWNEVDVKTLLSLASPKKV